MQLDLGVHFCADRMARPEMRPHRSRSRHRPRRRSRCSGKMGDVQRPRQRNDNPAVCREGAGVSTAILLRVGGEVVSDPDAVVRGERQRPLQNLPLPFEYSAQPNATPGFVEGRPATIKLKEAESKLNGEGQSDRIRAPSTRGPPRFVGSIEASVIARPPPSCSRSRRECRWEDAVLSRR